MTNTIIMEIDCRELCRSANLADEVLLHLVSNGIVEPLQGNDIDSWIFSANIVQHVKKAARLQRELEIEWHAIALVLDLLAERDVLQTENAMLKQRLSRFVDRSVD